MSRELKIGDRVHTTRGNRQKRYHPGDKGTVLQTLNMHDGGLPFCLVAMDKDLPTTGVLFDTGEIEANLMTTADRERSRHES
jgi:hypothetical protein